MMKRYWPEPIAKLIMKFYSKAINTNKVTLEKDLNKHKQTIEKLEKQFKQVYEDKTEEYIGFGYKIFKIVDGEEIKVKEIAKELKVDVEDVLFSPMIKFLISGIPKQIESATVVPKRPDRNGIPKLLPT